MNCQKANRTLFIRWFWISFSRRTLTGSLDLGLDPPVHRLVWGSPVTLRASLVAWSAAHRYMALFLLVCNDWALHKSRTVSPVSTLLSHCHWPIVAVTELRRGQIHLICTTRFEATLVKSQMIVCIASVRALRIGDETANFVRITFLVKCCIVRCLEVVVYHTSLLLFFKREIVPFKLGF